MTVTKEKPDADATPHRKELNLYQRLNQVMEEVSYVQRERKAEMKYSIVSHDAVTGAVRPSLVKWGVLVVMPELRFEQNGNRTELYCTIRFINVDVPSDQLDVQSFGYGIDPQDKGPGKAMSYAYKYAIMKSLMMEAGEEDSDFHQLMKTPKGEDDPIYQNIQHFAEQLKKTKGVDALKKLADLNKGHLQDAAKKYPQETNEVRAAFAAKLAEAKEEEKTNG